MCLRPFWGQIILSLNFIAATVLYFLLLFNVCSRVKYHFLANDMTGNYINFVALQIIFAFIFVVTSNRIDRLNIFHEKIQKAEKLNTVGQLAATMAHEIRNPLTVVRGFLQVFNQTEKLTMKSKEHLEMMLQEVDHAQSIINDYLSLAKPMEAKMLMRIDVVKNIHNVIDLMSSYALLHNIEFHKSIDSHLWMKANSLEMNQLLVNIIKNAVEAMETGGKVEVDARKQNGYVIINISDTGKGLTANQIERLGTPFYSINEKGTGIGLMICYQIMEKFHGEIKVTSMKGVGTTFSLLFPSC